MSVRADNLINHLSKWDHLRVAALAGGVGGAKMAHGFAQVLPPENLTIIVNTGDDFNHMGLRICPDIDTVCYTLAGLANPVTGWGRKDETWNALEGLERLRGLTWFRMGDRDLATHLERTRRLDQGEALSSIVQSFCEAWDVKQRVLPMTDQVMETWVDCEDEGWLPFQEYFVHQQCKPRVKGFQFKGYEAARPAPGVIEALESADVIIICPSNPWVSIGPILALPPVRELVGKKKAVAVSPIIGGQAIKGPAAKMYHELGIQPSALAVAQQYQDFISGFVMDQVDQDLEEQISRMGIEVLTTEAIMKTTGDRRRLAIETLSFFETLDGRQQAL